MLKPLMPKRDVLLRKRGHLANIAALQTDDSQNVVPLWLSAVEDGDGHRN